MDTRLLYKLSVGECGKAKVTYDIVLAPARREYSVRKYYFSHKFFGKPDFIELEMRVFNKEFDIHGQPLHTDSRGY